MIERLEDSADVASTTDVGEDDSIHDEWLEAVLERIAANVSYRHFDVPLLYDAAVVTDKLNCEHIDLPLFLDAIPHFSITQFNTNK